MGVLINKKILNIPLLVCLLFFIYQAFWKYLGDYTLRLWDEGRNAVNALEMVKNKNYWVTTYLGEPERWNTKPPLLIWLQSISFRVFGFNEWALRLPSALAVSLITISLYKFFGILPALILLSSMGFADWHIARTGDYDALLAMWLWFSMLAAWKKNLVGFWLFTLLAVLTKGVAGLMFVPSVIMYLVFCKYTRKDLLGVKSVLAMFVGVMVVFCYYLVRSHYQFDYWQGVVRSELGRLFSPVDTGANDLWFYGRYLWEYRFSHWLIWLLVLPLGYFWSKREDREKICLATFVIVSYFGLISLSATKQLWYDAPLYPLLSWLVGLNLLALINKLPVLARILTFAVLFFFLQRYIRTNLAYVARPDLEKDSACIKYGYVFRNQDWLNKIDDGAVFVQEDFCSPLDFYLERENWLVRRNWQRKSFETLVVGDKLITCDKMTADRVNAIFKTTPTGVFDNYCFDLLIN